MVASTHTNTLRAILHPIVLDRTFMSNPKADTYTVDDRVSLDEDSRAFDAERALRFLPTVHEQVVVDHHSGIGRRRLRRPQLDCACPIFWDRRHVVEVVVVDAVATGKVTPPTIDSKLNPGVALRGSGLAVFHFIVVDAIKTGPFDVNCNTIVVSEQVPEIGR